MAGSLSPSYKAALIRRLSHYWKVEAANIVAVPVLAVWAIKRSGNTISFSLIVAMAAACFMLLIGTFALRIKLETAKGRRSFGQRWLPWLSQAQLPALVMVVAAVAAAGLELWADGRRSNVAIATVVCALLAILEYINYYHVQLQNFDHLPDLKRFMAGGGFRKSHLARALQRFRADKRKLTIAEVPAGNE
jgi:hypothetical protein